MTIICFADIIAQYVPDQIHFRPGLLLKMLFLLLLTAGVLRPWVGLSGPFAVLGAYTIHIPYFLSLAPRALIYFLNETWAPIGDWVFIFLEKSQ